LPGVLPPLPIVVTLLLFAWNLGLSLVVNDFVKLVLLKSAKLGK